MYSVPSPTNATSSRTRTFSFRRQNVNELRVRTSHSDARSQHYARNSQELRTRLHNHYSALRPSSRRRRCVRGFYAMRASRAHRVNITGGFCAAVSSCRARKERMCHTDTLNVPVRSANQQHSCEDTRASIRARNYL